jgi:hypothetical protein
MSNMLQILLQLSTSTVEPSQRQALIKELATSYQLDQAATNAMLGGDLAALLASAGMSRRGCFMIVAPDEPNGPEQDDTPKEEEKVRLH